MKRQWGVLILLMLLSLQGTGQTLISREEFADLEKGIGDTLIFNKTDGSILKSGSYKLQAEPNEPYFIYFDINGKGRVDSMIVRKQGRKDIFARAYLRNNVFYRTQIFHEGTNILGELEYMERDTIYKFRYTKKGFLKNKSVKVRGGKTLYYKNCSYDADDGSVGDCTVRDEVKKSWEYYDENGILRQQEIKDVSQKVASKKTYFSEKGVRTRTVIVYRDERVKEIAADGSYEIIEYTIKGKSVRGYNRKGKLLYKSVLPEVDNVPDLKLNEK